MGIAIMMLAFYGLCRLIGWIDDTVRFWQLKSQFDQVQREVQEYDEAGHTLNVRAGIRRLKIIHAEMEKYR